jgi:hypothetical protein
LRIFFVFETHVDVSYQIYSIQVNQRSCPTRRVFQGRTEFVLTIVIVITNNNLLDQPILAQLAPDVLVKRIKVHLDLLRVHLVLGVVLRVLVEVREQDRLRVGWLDVFARAPVAMAAGADFVVEGAVDLWVGC